MRQLRAAMLAVGLIAWWGCPPAQAYEQVAAFVDALCERGYHDTALEYLDSLRSADYVSKEVRASLPYRQADVLIRQAEATNDAGVKTQLLAEATDKIEQFLATSPAADLASAATGRLAAIAVEKARSLASIARSSTGEAREAKLAEARGVFEQARKSLVAAEKQFAAALDAMPKLLAPGEEDQKQRKNELAAELAKVQFTLASIDYEVSKTYEPNSDDAKRYLGLAAERFEKLYEQYRTRGAGLIALLWAGRCQQELGNNKNALGCYQDLLELPGKSREVRAIRAKALRQALEVWTSANERKYEEAIRRGQEWLSAESRWPANDADGLAIRYWTAVANQKQMATLSKKSGEYRNLRQTALKLARQAARYPGEFKRPASQLISALGGEGKDDADAEPTTFAAARQKAIEALDRMQTARMGKEISEQTGEKDQVELYDQQEAEARADAARYFQLALQLNAKGATIEELNSTRYYTCYFLYDAGNYLDAAVIGEFLAKQYPKTMEGRQGARLAMASWVKLYTDSRSSDKSFEIDRIDQLADFVIQTWPDQPEAIDAAATQLSFAIQRRDVEKVLACLARIPADSPRRADSELRAGQSLWASYLKSLSLPEDERPAAEQLAQQKAKAFEILQSGVERMKEQAEGQATPALLTALLSLAQINLDMGNTAASLEILEDESLGPLTLLKAGDASVTNNPQLPIEIYKLALRAYVASEPPRVEDAERIMNDLESAVKATGDSQANETLTRIYISLGRELQQQLDELRASKKTKELKMVSQGFETFLSRIAGRDAGNTWSSLTWVAETFYSLGTGFDDPKQGPSPDGIRYYEQAVKAYEEILSRAAADPSFAPNPDALVGVRLRAAMCLRKIGKYDEALAKIAAVLKERPMMLPAQVLGAETYQAKGSVDKEAYARAILGGTEKDSKNQSIIWGWAKLSKLTMNDDRFADTFHQSRIQMAKSRYLYGRKNPNKQKGRKTINAAKEDLWITYKLYPDLGGEERAQEYNRLLVQIQRALGDKTVGLEEFRRRAAAADKAAAAAVSG